MLLSRLLVQLVIEFHLNPTVVKGKFLAIIHSLAKIYGETRNKLTRASGKHGRETRSGNTVGKHGRETRSGNTGNTGVGNTGQERQTHGKDTATLTCDDKNGWV